MTTRKNNPFIVFIACFVFYLVLRVGFDFLGAASDIVQIRPASALGPVLGFYFGLPGILGCAAANFVGDFLQRGNIGLLLLAYFATQVIYNGLPRWIWYLIYRKSKTPYMRFDSAASTTLCLLLVLIDSLAINAFNLCVLGTTSDTPIPTALANRSLNNVWMLLYVGIPLLYALERSPLAQAPPPWIHEKYKHQKNLNLTQRIVFAFIICTAALLLLATLILISSDIADDDLNLAVRTMFEITAKLALPVLIPLLAFLRYLETRIIRPIELLSNDQKEFAARIEKIEENSADINIDLNNTMSAKKTSKTKPATEVVDLIISTNNMRASLLDLNSRIYDMTAREQRASAELDIATQIQMSAVPSGFEKLERNFGLDIAAVMKPAREVGGDFYDAFEVDDNKIAFIIGDVSGKGVPAALFMMRSLSIIRQNIATSSDLGDAITQANNEICARNSACLFVTAFACVMDVDTGELTYVNAGHSAPVVVKRDAEAKIVSGKHGLVLGAMEGFPYAEQTLNLDEGGGIVLYTDGITEAANEADELFGESRMIDALSRKTTYNPSMDIKIAELIDGVENFAGDAPQADDITVIGFSRNPSIKKINIEPQIDALSQLAEFISGVCTKIGASDKFENELNLAAEEAFVNICTYGFCDEIEKAPVKVIAITNQEKRTLTLILVDKGLAFNPLAKEVSKANPDDEKRVGGLGILLIDKFTDDVDYTYANGCNILSMTKSYV